MDRIPPITPSFFIFIVLVLSVYADQTVDSDRVVNLPEQPSTPSVSQYSGYVTVNRENGRALFFWFFEALSDAATRPLVLWLNGGPGCSSIGYGAASEIGPFRVVQNGTTLTFNEYSWIKEANVLFLESPVGVGFSYTNSSSDLDNLNDDFVAEDAYSFLVAWFTKYSQYKSLPFFLAGESYAGHYAPQLAELIYDRNKIKPKESYINLKGFIVGNPLTDEEYDNNGIVEYAWSHSVISDNLFHHLKRVCDFKSSILSQDCNVAMNTLFNSYSDIDIYNIYAPKCLTTANTSVHKVIAKEWYGRMRLYGGYDDPCYSTYAEEYFNRVDVQSALHAIPNNNQKWRVCNDGILRRYNFTVDSMLPTYKKLIKAGLRIWVYSGDTDGRVPVIGTRYWIEALSLPLVSEWRSWLYDGQVGGRTMEYEGIRMVTVRGAGHLVPLNNPQHALFLFSSFLNSLSLP